LKERKRSERKTTSFSSAFLKEKKNLFLLNIFILTYLKKQIPDIFLLLINLKKKKSSIYLFKYRNLLVFFLHIYLNIRMALHTNVTIFVINQTFFGIRCSKIKSEPN
jgi:hypothetical protein